MSNEWLSIAKKQYKGNFLNFLAFKRNEEAPILNYLYDRLIENLKIKEILFDSITKKYYKTDEIILADGFDKGLFPDNKINNKRLNLQSSICHLKQLLTILKKNVSYKREKEILNTLKICINI